MHETPIDRHSVVCTRWRWLQRRIYSAVNPNRLRRDSDRGPASLSLYLAFRDERLAKYRRSIVNGLQRESSASRARGCGSGCGEARAAESGGERRRRAVLSLNGTRLGPCSIVTTKGGINTRVDGKTGCKSWWFTHI